MDNKNKLIIGLAAGCCLLVGVLIGVLVAHPSSGKTSVAEEVVVAEPIVEQPTEPETKVEEEKTYGFYPSFYVKRQYYTVSSSDADHTLIVYTNGSTQIARAWTDSRWLEEEKLERGGTYFHVKKNKDSDSRKGKLYLQDDRGRKITIYVTQRGRR